MNKRTNERMNNTTKTPKEEAHKKKVARDSRTNTYLNWCEKNCITLINAFTNGSETSNKYFEEKKRRTGYYL